MLNRPVCTAQGVKVSWSRIGSAPGYRVYVRSGSSWKKLADTANAYYVHKNAVSGVSYTYTVSCVTADGKQALSGRNANGKSVLYIAAPQLKSLHSSAKGVTLTWSASKGAAKYRVYCRSGSSWKKLVDTKSTSFTHSAVTSGKKYTYCVRCINATGTAFTSAAGTAKSAVFLKMPQITGFSDELGGTKINWTASAGAAKYRLFVKDGSTWKAIADTADTTYTHFTGHDTTAVYTVRAVNAAKNAYSAYDTNGRQHHYLIPETGFGAPVINSFENTGDGLVIRWDPVEGSERYLVLTSQNGKWNSIASTGQTSYCYTGAPSGVSRSYTVGCITADGTAYAGRYDTVGKPFTYVPAPVMEPVVCTDCGPMLRWSSCPGAARYRIMMRAADGEWSVLAETGETGYLHTDAAENTGYTYRVLCLNDAGEAVNASPAEGSTVLYQRDLSRHIFTEAMFADSAAAVLNKAVAAKDPNAPLNRRNVSEILVGALNYTLTDAIRLHDSSDKSLQTAVYYGYFLPDSADNICPDRLIASEDYIRLMTEISRYAALKGKRILAFGDSIMYGKGNPVSENRHAGFGHMIAEKYGMKFKSCAVSGATFSLRNSRPHIPEQLQKAYLSGYQPDLILLNGATNDMRLVSLGNSPDTYDPKNPQNSNFAIGFEYMLTQIHYYWKDVPVVYVRAHNMDICSDTLERQMGEYGLKIAAKYGCCNVDIYRNTSLNTERDSDRIRYTGYNPDKGRNDGVHPNALGYATYYLPLVSEGIVSILLP